MLLKKKTTASSVCTFSQSRDHTGLQWDSTAQHIQATLTLLKTTTTVHYPEVRVIIATGNTPVAIVTILQPAQGQDKVIIQDTIKVFKAAPELFPFNL